MSAKPLVGRLANVAASASWPCNVCFLVVTRGHSSWLLFLLIWSVETICQLDILQYLPCRKPVRSVHCFCIINPQSKHRQSGTHRHRHSRSYAFLSCGVLENHRLRSMSTSQMHRSLERDALHTRKSKQNVSLASLAIGPVAQDKDMIFYVFFLFGLPNPLCWRCVYLSHSHI